MDNCAVVVRSHNEVHAMPRGRPMAPLTITAEDREVLSRWLARPKTGQALALRARLVLRCAHDLPHFQVAEELKGGQDMVGKSRPRFINHGPPALPPAPRP